MTELHQRRIEESYLAPKIFLLQILALIFLTPKLSSTLNSSQFSLSIFNEYLNASDLMAFYDVDENNMTMKEIGNISDDRRLCVNCYHGEENLKEGTVVPSKELSILGLFELSTKDGIRPEGMSELAAAQLAIKHVNQRNILPGYSLKLYANDTMCDPGVGVDRFFHAIHMANTTMLMLLGTACSNVTESLAKIVPYWNMVQVSFGATSPALSDRSEFPFFFRTVAADCSHNPAKIAFIRHYGWNAVVAFSQNEEQFSLASNELVTALEAANITCTASLSFSRRNFKEQLKQLKELDTRIVIGSFAADFLPKIFCEIYNLGMMEGEYAWIVSGSSVPVTPIPCKQEQYSKALEGVVLVSSNNDLVFDDPEPLSGLSYDEFLDEMTSLQVPLSSYSVQAYDAVWAVAVALRNADLLLRRSRKMSLSEFDYKRRGMAEEFMKQMQLLNFTGVSGPLSFNGPNRVGTTAFHQMQNGALETLALYRGSQLAWSCGDCGRWGREDGIVPPARRMLRVRVLRPAPPARLAVAALAFAGVALTVVFFVFNLHYAELRSFKLSSPRLNNMTLVGCVLVYMAVALLALDTSLLSDTVPFSVLCTGKVYLLAAGFSLAFGSMFAKTYRVHRIFISKYRGICKTKLLHDTQLISLVCVLLLIDGLVVTVWVTTDPMEKHLRNLTREISSSDRAVIYQPQVEICKSRHMTVWLGSLYAYKGLLLIMGVYMAWETRHVKISALNDSKYIGISVYCVVITSAGVVVLGNIISERITLVFVTINGLILLTTTGTLCLLFLPKLINFFKNRDADPVIQSMGLKIEYNTRRFVAEDPQELYYRTQIQNKVYRKEIAALDREIQRLEKMLLDPQSSRSSSVTSILTAKKVDAQGSQLPRSEGSRLPSISGQLPMLLLSILPPVIPRASWPSAYNSVNSEIRKSVTFSSQPKLFNDNTDMENVFDKSMLNRNKSEAPGLLGRLRTFFGSRPVSRKPSTVSIADTGTAGIAKAFKTHMEVIAGIVPAFDKERSKNLQVPNLSSHFAKSGPTINIISDSTLDLQKDDDMDEILPFDLRNRCKSQTFEPKVYFSLPEEDNVSTEIKRVESQSINHFREKAHGSPRFPRKWRLIKKQEAINNIDSSEAIKSAKLIDFMKSLNVLDKDPVKGFHSSWPNYKICATKYQKYPRRKTI